MIRMMLLAFAVLSLPAFSQTYDEVVRQIDANQEQARLQKEIASYQARNQQMQASAAAFAAALGEGLQSGPSCVTMTDEDKRREAGMSFWPGTYAAMDRDVFRSNNYSYCDFTTSGGKICKTYGSGYINCVTGQQTKERFCLENGRVRVLGDNSYCNYPGRTSRTHSQNRVKRSAPLGTHSNAN